MQSTLAVHIERDERLAAYWDDLLLGALLVLVGRAAADADPTDLHIVCGHDWKPPGKRDEALSVFVRRGPRQLGLIQSAALLFVLRRRL